MKELILITDDVKKLIPSQYKDIKDWLTKTRWEWMNIRISVLPTNSHSFAYPAIDVVYDIKPEDMLYREKFEYLISQCGRVV